MKCYVCGTDLTRPWLAEVSLLYISRFVGYITGPHKQFIPLEVQKGHLVWQKCFGLSTPTVMLEMSRGTGEGINLK